MSTKIDIPSSLSPEDYIAIYHRIENVFTKYVELDGSMSALDVTGPILYLATVVINDSPDYVKTNEAHKLQQGIKDSYGEQLVQQLQFYLGKSNGVRSGIER